MLSGPCRPMEPVWMSVCPSPGSAGAGRNARTEELGTLASATQGSEGVGSIRLPAPDPVAAARALSLAGLILHSVKVCAENMLRGRSVCWGRRAGEGERWCVNVEWVCAW